jgi:hypothetical protein
MENRIENSGNEDLLTLPGVGRDGNHGERDLRILRTPLSLSLQREDPAISNSSALRVRFDRIPFLNTLEIRAVTKRRATAHQAAIFIFYFGTNRCEGEEIPALEIGKNSRSKSQSPARLRIWHR